MTILWVSRLDLPEKTSKARQGRWASTQVVVGNLTRNTVSSFQRREVASPGNAWQFKFSGALRPLDGIGDLMFHEFCRLPCAPGGGRVSP
jgi:hypothetical protein